MTDRIETWEQGAGEVLNLIIFDDPRTMYDRGDYMTLARWAYGEWTKLCHVHGGPACRHDHIVRTLAGKQHDYGSENINKFGHDGLRVRLWDKIARYENLVRRGTDSRNEAIEDTLLDIVGYCTIYFMLAYKDNETDASLFDLPLSVDVVPPIAEIDPELERLLAEEEEIERGYAF